MLYAFLVVPFLFIAISNPSPPPTPPLLTTTFLWPYFCPSSISSRLFGEKIWFFFSFFIMNFFFFGNIYHVVRAHTHTNQPTNLLFANVFVVFFVCVCVCFIYLLVIILYRLLYTSPPQFKIF